MLRPFYSLQRNIRYEIMNFVVRLSSFVDTVYSNHYRTNIEKRSLRCCKEFDYNRVYNWIYEAIGVEVKHCDLYVCSNGQTILPYYLPLDIFTCGTLVTLKLDLELLILNVPDVVSFPRLKSLHLRSVEFLDDDSFKRLLASCIDVEKFVIKYCVLKILKELCISLQFLKRLTMVFPTSDQSGNYRVVLDTPMLWEFQYYGNEAPGYSLINL
ncbi:hypothetical protein PTKIN_Ptkin07bG0103200 [Pterospermum kingtungense]